YPSPTPVPELHIRAARFADLPLIQEIHNQGIADRVATLDIEPRTMADTQLWFYRHGPRHPVLVVEADGSIAGWASLNTFNPRPAPISRWLPCPSPGPASGVARAWGRVYCTRSSGLPANSAIIKSSCRPSRPTRLACVSTSGRGSPRWASTRRWVWWM